MGLAAVRGGSQLGLIRFVNRDGAAVGPGAGCTSSYIFNYYGSGGAAVDPACHPDATAVQSYRHSHYGKDRFGVTLDEEWFATLGAAGSTLRAGIWYEDSRRDLGRDWHRILDPSIGFNWDERPYWQQYEWEFPQQVFKWYLEETIFAGPFAVSGGVKQFLVGVSREDLFNADPISRSIPTRICSSPAASRTRRRSKASTCSRAIPRTSRRSAPCSSRCRDAAWTCSSPRRPRTSTSACSTRESGSRWAPRGTPSTSRTGSSTSARRRPPSQLPHPGGGAYFNAGGIDTSGVEFSATVQLPQRTSFYTAFTFNESEYIGTGDPLVDASQGLVAGTDVTGVPDRLWVVSLDRTGPLGMGLTAKYTSSRRVSLRSDWYTDPYWLVDAYVSFSGRALSDLLRSTEFAIVANNLLDKAYLSAITENAAWLGAPRTISMTATVSF